MAGKATGLARLVGATRYSLAGIGAALKHEEAFRIEAALAVVMLPAALVLGDGPVERVLLVASVLLVLAIELVNSAIEAIVDRIGVDWHELSGRAKDMGSAAVFVALVNAGATWTLLLYDDALALVAG